MKNDDRYPEGTTCSACYRAGLPQPDYSHITDMDAVAQAEADHLRTHCTMTEAEAIADAKRYVEEHPEIWPYRHPTTGEPITQGEADEIIAAHQALVDSGAMTEDGTPIQTTVGEA